MIDATTYARRAAGRFVAELAELVAIPSNQRRPATRV